MTTKSRLIIKDVLDFHGVHPDDFFGRGRLSYIVDARRDAAQRLLAAGYNLSQVGRFMCRSPSTVLNYFPKLVEAKRARYAAKKIMRWLAPEACDVVIAIANAEGVTPEVLMAGWVSERATYESMAKARLRDHHEAIQNYLSYYQDVSEKRIQISDGGQ